MKPEDFGSFSFFAPNSTQITHASFSFTPMLSLLKVVNVKMAKATEIYLQSEKFGVKNKTCRRFSAGLSMKKKSADFWEIFFF